MTVKKDLEKALAAAQAAKGTYATFATSTDDQGAQTMFEQMAQDMDRHIAQLNSRVSETSETKLSNRQQE
ncbi:DUF1657 domain-containing protein [Sporomusa acidovorans]|uniref:Rubrerythrin family protein n=1 Tax=Sporomusa acidovorans (strain ATCC 49682 / DSM 3132 / Mol) TaxID=1123286 RepID=A0ABZ3IYG6_SPOA4|nr:DUF1657 domain-containing protein [Sporomusa acidovorans]OZC16857.1 hypothetical protein SPACI_40770 [Sporomusa acidovorans DSM 3132]SDF24501.1 Protein of unknown function [Sporomusa acidovorans]